MCEVCGQQEGLRQPVEGEYVREGLKARGKDKKEDGDDDVDTLETALRLLRSSKQGLKRKQSDGSPEATSSSSQAQPE